MTEADLQTILDSLKIMLENTESVEWIYLKDILNKKSVKDEVKSSAIILCKKRNSASIHPSDLISEIKTGYLMGKLGKEYLSDKKYDVAGKSFEKGISYGSIESAEHLSQMIIENKYNKSEPLEYFIETLSNSNLINDSDLLKTILDIQYKLKTSNSVEARHISSDIRCEIEHVLRTLTGSTLISNSLIRKAYEDGYICLNDQKIFLDTYRNLSDVLHSSETLHSIDACVDSLETIKHNHPESFKIKVRFCSENTVFKEYTLAYGSKIPKPENNPKTRLKGYKFKRWSGYNEGRLATGSAGDDTITFEAVFEPEAKQPEEMDQSIYWKNLAFSYLNKDSKYVSGNTDVLSEAYRCFKNSAELGNQDSRYNIALMIEGGLIDRPLIEAFEIYYDMSHEGDMEAVVKVQDMINSGKPELISKLYSFYNSRGLYSEAKKFKIESNKIELKIKSINSTNKSPALGVEKTPSSTNKKSPTPADKKNSTHSVKKDPTSESRKSPTHSVKNNPATAVKKPSSTDDKKKNKSDSNKNNKQSNRSQPHTATQTHNTPTPPKPQTPAPKPDYSKNSNSRYRNFEFRGGDDYYWGIRGESVAFER